MAESRAYARGPLPRGVTDCRCLMDGPGWAPGHSLADRGYGLEVLYGRVTDEGFQKWD